MSTVNKPLLVLTLLWNLSAFGQQPKPLLPDPKLTPGDVFDVTLRDICTPGYSKKVRAVTAKLKRQAYARYGITSWEPGDYEIDNLIPLSLGGSNSIRNLWPQSYKTSPWNAHVKDVLERRLHRLVCAGKVDLKTAQQEIATDWIRAYQKYVAKSPPTPEMRSRKYPHPLRQKITADQNALSITQQVLAYLQSLTSKSSGRVLSGQLADFERYNWNGIQTIWNTPLPAVMGFSQDCFQGVGKNGCTLGRYKIVVPIADVIAHWNGGGLVYATENPPNPKTLAGQNDTNFNQSDMASLLSQTGTIWTNYKAFMDASAATYATLQSAGVVVILHLLHEMNASWFWYGASEITSAQYIALWQMQFQYYTVTKGLHNLLFTYGPGSDSGNVDGYYPGDNFIDIIGPHNYYGSDATPIPDLGNAYATLTASHPNKPFGFTEMGLPAGNATCPTPAMNYYQIIAGIKQNMPKACFFWCWRDVWGMGYTCRDNVQHHLNVDQLLNDPWVVNKGGVILRTNTNQNIAPSGYLPAGGTGH